jgi:hypothetical protein
MTQPQPQQPVPPPHAIVGAFLRLHLDEEGNSADVEFDAAPALGRMTDNEIEEFLIESGGFDDSEDLGGSDAADELGSSAAADSEALRHAYKALEHLDLAGLPTGGSDVYVRSSDLGWWLAANRPKLWKQFTKDTDAAEEA